MSRFNTRGIGVSPCDIFRKLSLSKSREWERNCPATNRFCAFQQRAKLPAEWDPKGFGKIQVYIYSTSRLWFRRGANACTHFEVMIVGDGMKGGKKSGAFWACFFAGVLSGLCLQLMILPFGYSSFYGMGVMGDLLLAGIGAVGDLLIASFGIAAAFGIYRILSAKSRKASLPSTASQD